MICVCIYHKYYTHTHIINIIHVFMIMGDENQIVSAVQIHGHSVINAFNIKKIQGTNMERVFIDEDYYNNNISEQYITEENIVEGPIVSAMILLDNNELIQVIRNYIRNIYVCICVTVLFGSVIIIIIIMTRKYYS